MTAKTKPATAAGPESLLDAEPAWAAYLAEAEVIEQQRRAIAEQVADLRQARQRAESEHADAVRAALEAGRPIPPAPVLDGLHLDQAAAIVERKSIAHTQRRNMVLAECAPSVERAVRERVKARQAEVKPLAEQVTRVLEDVRGSLRVLAEVYSSVDARNQLRTSPTRSSRVRVDITAGELLHAAQNGEDLAELRPVDVLRAPATLGFSTASGVSAADEAAAAESRKRLGRDLPPPPW